MFIHTSYMHADFIKITQNDTKKKLFQKCKRKLNRNYSKHVMKNEVKTNENYSKNASLVINQN